MPIFGSYIIVTETFQSIAYSLRVKYAYTPQIHQYYLCGIIKHKLSRIIVMHI